jgi:hypothetical protein
MVIEPRACRKEDSNEARLPAHGVGQGEVAGADGAAVLAVRAQPAQPPAVLCETIQDGYTQWQLRNRYKRAGMCFEAQQC